MSAVKVTRAERLEEIRRLLREGWSQRQVARSLGLSYSTVREYLSDPDGSKQRQRRERYGAPCQRCGARTNGSNGYAKQATHCLPCQNELLHERRYWTRERIVAGLRKFAADHGRQPSATDLNAAGVAEHGYPPVTIVQREFGSWSNGIAAAGFEALSRGRRTGSYAIATDDLIQQIRDASVDGVAPPCQPDMSNTYERLRYRGISWQEACALAGVTPRNKRGPR